MSSMSYFLFATLLSGAILVSCQMDANTVSSSTEAEVDCELDHDRTNAQLSSCLEHGSRFLETYLKNLRRKKSHDKCASFTKFDECITPLLTKCHAIRHELRHHWRPVIEQMRCACNTGNAEACPANTTCFESEYRSVLSKRCYDMYKFNLRQQTRHRCHFLADKIHCVYGLVDSRCGPQTGNFSFHIAKLSELDQIERGRCYVKQDNKYPTFRYEDDTCPQEFLKSMDKCLHDNLNPDNMLYFNAENDLVVDGNARDVKKACNVFKRYRQCTRPIRKECKTGTALIFQYMETLRTYNMKLNYICGENKTDYMDNLQCYQNVLANKTLTQCNNIWSDLRPLLDNLTSHQFYCLPEHKQSLQLQREIDRLSGCYKEVFTHSCGSTGGAVFAELTQVALTDPFYLRLDYQPNCEVHREPAESIPSDHPVRDAEVKPRPPQSWTTLRPKRTKPVEGKKPSSGGSTSSRGQPSGAAYAHPTVIVLLAAVTLLDFLRR